MNDASCKKNGAITQKSGTVTFTNYYGKTLTAEPIDAIRTVLNRLQIRDQSLLVAVSGGADSVALLLLLNDLKDEFRLQLHVGHFDHQLRDGSARDADWVQALCEKRLIKCVVGTPLDNDKSSFGGIEESARKQRYHFLQSLAEDISSRWIAVAHTENDQVETVLHHIARGTGLKGLQGIPEVREVSSEISLLRPLLKIQRTQLIETLASRQQEHRTDETNSDSSFTRNRIRHDVLPFLRTHLNGQIDRALLRLSIQAQDAQSVIDQIADKLLSEALSKNEALQESLQKNGLVRLQVEPFQSQPRAIVIAAFMDLWNRQQWPRQNMSQHHWSQLADIVSENHSGTGLSCPGPIQVTLRRNVLEIRRNHDLT